MEDQHFIARLVKDDFHKMLITIIVFIALYFFYVNKANSEDFLDCIEDIPLVNKLYEKKDSCFYFDSDEGRVANVEAVGSVRQDTILNFYLDVLPQLGWKINTDDSYDNVIKFNRGKELLNVLVHENNKKSLVIFFSFLLLDH